MVSIAACHAVDRSSILLGTAIFARFVYRFRTPAFHVGKTGSIPVSSASIFGELAERLRQQFAKLSLGNRWIGSIPILSAKFIPV